LLQRYLNSVLQRSEDKAFGEEDEPPAGFARDSQVCAIVEKPLFTYCMSRQSNNKVDLLQFHWRHLLLDMRATGGFS
jgi:hypothetical protein